MKKKDKVKLTVIMAENQKSGVGNPDGSFVGRVEGGTVVGKI
jgi:hypothetical protein